MHTRKGWASLGNVLVNQGYVIKRPCEGGMQCTKKVQKNALVRHRHWLGASGRLWKPELTLNSSADRDAQGNTQSMPFVDQMGVTSSNDPGIVVIGGR